jgi:tetratricopeptide (TPR) repeat protein
MSESERASRPKRHYERQTLVIRREDHVGDPISIAWLVPAETLGDAIVGRLRDYLGRRVRIKKAEISRDTIEVQVEVRGWREEASRLAGAARDLAEKGAKRGALAMCREALELDSLSAEAMTAMGTILAALGKDQEALDAFQHAREFGAEGVSTLLAMLECAVRLGWLASAGRYAEEALRLDPGNLQAQDALHAIRQRFY